MKGSQFPSDCKIAKLKPIIQKRVKNRSKNLSHRSTFATCFKVIEKDSKSNQNVLKQEENFIYININQGFKNDFQQNLV